MNLENPTYIRVIKWPDTNRDSRWPYPCNHLDRSSRGWGVYPSMYVLCTKHVWLNKTNDIHVACSSVTKFLTNRRIIYRIWFYKIINIIGEWKTTYFKPTIDLENQSKTHFNPILNTGLIFGWIFFVFFLVRK